MYVHDTYFKLNGLLSWFALAMLLACMWLPIAFGAFALGRRRVTVRFWLLLVVVEGVALAVFKYYVLGIALSVPSPPTTLGSPYFHPLAPSTTAQPEADEEDSP
jgi:hypothetical protein